MYVEDLTLEQRAKVRECKTPEDLLAFAQEQGFEIGDTELKALTVADAWNTCSKDTNSGPY